MSEPTGPDPGVPEKAKREHQDPPLWSKIVIVTFAAIVVTFLLFCAGILAAYGVEKMWNATFG